jgi:hypothetical protein
MTKLTPEQIEEIKKAYGEGQTCVDLAKAYGVSQPTISYHVNPSVKSNSLEYVKKAYGEMTPEQKKKKTSQHAEYIKNYMKNRYNNDLEFRKKFIADQIQYRRKRKQKAEKLKAEIKI